MTPVVLRVLLSSLLLAFSLLGTACDIEGRKKQTTLRFWAMGREGEVVQELIHDFEKENPSIRVAVQQIPWSAAHEKLLTAHVGRSTPDIAQMGNTWIAEFAALRALEPLDAWTCGTVSIDSTWFFPGIWETNSIDGEIYGIPWYVDTRVLFYRRDILEEAGYASIPRSWSEWKRAMEAVKSVVGLDRFVIFLPINEWSQMAIFGLQMGSPLVIDGATRGGFRRDEFRRAFAFYLDLFRSDLAPPVANTEIANVYQEFARGYFSMYITGPWNLGEFRRRLPQELQSSWTTAPLPGPDSSAGGVSLAGGSSLVLFRGSEHKESAWRLIGYLSRTEQQVRFYELTGDLPAREEAWNDPLLARDDAVRSFKEQLNRVVSTPKIPEWEQIAYRLQDKVEAAVRGGVSAESALTSLDRDVDRILEKRRWLLARRQEDVVPERVSTP